MTIPTMATPARLRPRPPSPPRYDRTPLLAHRLRPGNTSLPAPKVPPQSRAGGRYPLIIDSYNFDFVGSELQQEVDLSADDPSLIHDFQTRILQPALSHSSPIPPPPCCAPPKPSSAKSPTLTARPRLPTSARLMRPTIPAPAPINATAHSTAPGLYQTLPAVECSRIWRARRRCLGQGTFRFSALSS